MSGREKEQRGNERKERGRGKTETHGREKDPVSGQQTVSLKGKKNNRMMKDRVEGWGEEGKIGKREEQKTS